MSAPAPRHRAVPWRLPDLYLALGLLVAGVALLVVGYRGVDARSDFGDQLLWANVAIGGLISVATAGVVWVLAGMRATAELRRQLLTRLRAATAPAPVAEARPLVAGTGARLVTAPSMTRYHRPDCALVQGKAVAPLRRRDERDRRPCGVCLGAGTATAPSPAT